LIAAPATAGGARLTATTIIRWTNSAAGGYANRQREHEKRAFHQDPPYCAFQFGERAVHSRRRCGRLCGKLKTAEKHPWVAAGRAK
jgi:hypothetical protein